MKLSEITKETLTDDDIQKIIYENVDDNGKSSIYGLVLVVVIMELVIKIIM